MYCPDGLQRVFHFSNKPLDKPRRKRRSGQAFRVACLSEAYFHAARIEDALSQAKLALELSHEHQERGREAWILRLIGEIHARRDHSRTDQSEQHYRQALRKRTS